MRVVRKSGSNTAVGGEYASWEPGRVTADHPLRRRRCPAAHVGRFARHLATACCDVIPARAPRAAASGAERATVTR